MDIALVGIVKYLRCQNFCYLASTFISYKDIKNQRCRHYFLNSRLQKLPSRKVIQCYSKCGADVLFELLLAEELGLE